MANIIDRMAVFVAFYGIELPLITSKVLTACRPHDRPSLPLCMINGRIVRFLRASTHRLFHWMIILARDRLGSAEELREDSQKVRQTPYSGQSLLTQGQRLLLRPKSGVMRRRV